MKLLYIAANRIHPGKARRVFEQRCDDPVLGCAQISRLIGFADKAITFRRDVAAIGLDARFAGSVCVLVAMLQMDGPHIDLAQARRSEEHTSELQSLMRISYAVFCLKKKTKAYIQ